MSGDLIIGAGEHLVFFGDSITEATDGFVGIVREMISTQYPERGITVTNAGVGGDKVTSLEARLKSDVFDKKPDWVVTMVGVNDVWHGANGVPLDEYRVRLERMIESIQDAGIRQILMTPTVIGEDLGNEENRKLEGYVEALAGIGSSRDIPVIPLRTYFRNAIERSGISGGELLLTRDGVHLNHAGHLLVAIAILKQLKFDFSLGNLA